MAARNAFRDSSNAVLVYLRSLDVPLLIGTLFLCAAGVVNLYGLGAPDATLAERQAFFVLIGLALMVLFSFVNWRYLKNWSVPVMVVYGLAVLLLALTLLFPEVRGIRAWIVLGWFRLEPSELAKLALVILLAKYFSQRHIHIRQFVHVLVSGLYAAIPAGVILAQPDLGSAAILGIVWLVLLLAVGISRRHLFGILAVAVIGGYLAWVYALAPYQQERILAFIDPYADPAGYGYHIIQSRIAVGSGGLLGQGLGEGSQARLGFLPEPQNDFAFAAYVEQFGLVGAGALLGMVGLLVWRILKVGRGANSNFARLFCVGMGAIIFAHVVVSAGVNLGLLPITGLPFTFLSHGGSHLVAVLIGIGTVQSMHRYR